MRRAIRMGVVVGCVALAAGCAKAPRQVPVKMGPVNTDAGSVEATRRDLAGSWTLRQLEVIRQENVRQVVKAQGTLTYDEFGGLVVVAVIDDPRLVDTLVLNYTRRIVIDVVKHEFYPADFQSDRPVDETRVVPISMDKIRRYTLSGDTFTVTYLDANGKATAIAMWSRVPR